MIRTRFTLLWVLTFLVSVASFAQDGTNPAVTGVSISPAPITDGIGSTVTMSFTIGNNNGVSTAPISGTGFSTKMSFGITLGKIGAATPPGSETAALSGPLLNYFDISWNAVQKTFEGKQKQGVAIPANTLLTLALSATVSAHSSNTAINDIGASVNVAPNASASPQNPNDDFLSKYTHTTVTVAMPVSLVDFSAKAQDDRTVLVNWTTSWERANKGYVVERSKDLKNFEQVGEVSDVAGTSNSLNKYRFMDMTPYRGTSYYRLRQVDLDGSSQTFKAESVVIDGKYGVYPNPVVSQQFTLDLDEPETAVLRLYNTSGSELSVGKSDLTEMSTKVSTPSKLATGVYVLTVEERGTTRKHRLVVQ